MKTYVSITLEVPLESIDFDDCDGGNLAAAKFKGAAIDHFSTEDVQRAHTAMMDYLEEVEKVGVSYLERATASHNAAVALENQAMMQRERDIALEDPISMNRRNW